MHDFSLFFLVLPLLELFGGDQSGSEVAVSYTLGLPPRGVVLRHDLQDVSSFEGKSRLLAGCSLVFQRDVVKQGPHVHLEKQHGALFDLPGAARLMLARYRVTAPCSPSGSLLL